MLLVDANVLLHAVNDHSPQHPAARRWLGAALQGDEPVAFTWSVLLAFLRVSTHPAVFSRPLRADQAGAVVEGWLAAPHAIVVAPTSRHLPLLRGLLGTERTAGNLVNDAHLAALTLEHAATMVSFDRDFARFEGITTLRPA